MGDWIEMLPPQGLRDRYGRDITYLRVSVTDRCDFRCVYCMSEHMTFLPRRDLLSLEELDRLCSAFVRRGVRSCASPAASRWCATTSCGCSRRSAGISTAGGLEELTLTTNGSQLKRFAGAIEGGRRRAHQRLARYARRRPFPRHHPLGRLLEVMQGLDGGATLQASRSRSTP